MEEIATEKAQDKVRMNLALQARMRKVQYFAHCVGGHLCAVLTIHERCHRMPRRRLLS